MRIRISDDKTRKIYLAGLILFAIGLPLSKTLMSGALGVLALHWLFTAGYRKFPSGKSPRGAAFCFFLLIAVMHLAGLLWTQDFHYAFKDLRIKMPILLLPVFMLCAPVITRRQFLLVIMAFIWAVFAGSLVSLYILVTENPIDPRDLTPFISHIRFSMMVCLALFATVFLFLRHSSKPGQILLWGLLSVWLLVFLFMLESLTGVIAFFIILLVILIRLSVSPGKGWRRVMALIGLAALLGGGWMMIRFAATQFEPDTSLHSSNLEIYTKAGNPYFHDTASPVNENGNMVWLYVCEEEMREAWNRRSQIPFDSELAPGSKTGDVLMRYLASKALRRDAEGVNALSQEDVERVESGCTNYRYNRHSWMKRRFDQLKWEYWSYRSGGDPKGHSVLQRLELWEVGKKISAENLWIGVGTGDVKKAFACHLRAAGSSLAGTPLRGHNQFLTILITFGLPGLLLFMLAVLVPLILRRDIMEFTFIIFLIIVLFSMLLEDTLETQAGVSFFAFFYAFWIFQKVSPEPST